MQTEVFDLPKKVYKIIDEMPAISPILEKIKKFNNEMESSPKELVKIIMLDPVLTGEVLKLVNSSFYNLTQYVQSLAQAVVLLGINTVKNLAISTAILNTNFFNTQQNPLEPKTFWRHCLATAICCRLLAKELGVSPEEHELFFVAGLLHDIGKILLIKADPEAYKKAIKESQRLEITLSFSELAHFGYTHSQIGSLLAKKWKLDNSLIQIIELHHSISDNYSIRDNKTTLMKEVVIIANNLCKQILVGDSGNYVVDEITDDLIKQNNIKTEFINKIFNKIPIELDKATEFLNIIKSKK